jgi:transposase-like protein
MPKYADRKASHVILEEVGFEVLDAMVAKRVLELRSDPESATHHVAGQTFQSTAEAEVAESLAVFPMTFRLWMKRQRTIYFLSATDPDDVLDMIAGGESIESIAQQFNIAPIVLFTWLKTNSAPNALAAAKEAMADSRFAEIREAVKRSNGDEDIKRAALLFNVDKHVAAAHTSRYTENKTLKVTPGAGVRMDISFARTVEDEPQQDG